jgi:hypothetical protein
VHEMISKRYQFNETNTLNSIQDWAFACMPWPDRDPKSLENTLFVLIWFEELLMKFKVWTYKWRWFNTKFYACILLKAHSRSHSKSGGSIWASLECQWCFWIAGGLVLYLTMWPYSPSSYSKTTFNGTSTLWVWVSF